MKDIKVSLPFNIATEDLRFYLQNTSYKLADLDVRILKNIFVSHSGLCLNQHGLIKECHHDYPGQIDGYIKEVLYFYEKAKRNPDNLIHLNDKNTYLLIHHPWYNYYHWICEAIFRLWMVRGQLNNLILLLPEKYEKADFIMGSLKPFDLKNIYFIPEGKNLLIGKLVLPQIKPICDSYNAQSVLEIRDFYVNYSIKNFQPHPDFGEKIYISRELANRRKVLNEKEVTSILKDNGFAIFYPEKYTFLQQVAIFSKAKQVVSIHGSGLTNILFMPHGSSVFELIKGRTNDFERPSFLFWYLSDALGFRYYYQLCDQVSLNETYFNSDYIIDMPKFEINLRKFLSKP